MENMVTTLSIEVSNEEPMETNYGAIIREWIDDMLGKEKSQCSQRERRMGRVPPLLLRGLNNSKNKDLYEPGALSFGPYHHNKNKILRESEKVKRITLHLFVSSGELESSQDHYYNKVLEVVGVARKCYDADSTNDYDDTQFAKMMLQDACFILFFIEMLARRDRRIFLNSEYLGGLGFAYIIRDIFLLENQIPFVVLRVLMNLKFADGGEEILNGFFNYLNHGEVKIQREKKVLPSESEKQPLHLLELYRSYFICISCTNLDPTPDSTSGRWHKLMDDNNSSGDHPEGNFDYVKRHRSCPSITELKSKGIFLKPARLEPSEDIKFHSYLCHGELELVRRAISPKSKAMLLNMIAYEMCPHNPNDFRVATYISIMKSLIVDSNDVKILRSKNILIHSLGRDEEVVKMYEEMETPAVNTYMFSQLKHGIDEHCNSIYKKWIAELTSLYFSRPWKALAVFAGAAVLFLSFVQTFFTVWPLPDQSMDQMLILLKNCSNNRS